MLRGMIKIMVVKNYEKKNACIEKGAFKAIRKNVEELERDYWNIKNTYFDNNGWNAKEVMK